MIQDSKDTNRSILKFKTMVMEPDERSIRADHAVVLNRRDEQMKTIETIDDTTFNIDMSPGVVETAINSGTTIGKVSDDTVPDAELVLTRSQSAELQHQSEEKSCRERTEETATRKEQNRATSAPDTRGIPNLHLGVMYGAT